MLCICERERANACGRLSATCGGTHARTSTIVRIELTKLSPGDPSTIDVDADVCVLYLVVQRGTARIVSVLRLHHRGNVRVCISAPECARVRVCERARTAQ